MVKLFILVLLTLGSLHSTNASEQNRQLNAKCRDLLTCTINKGCVQVEKLAATFDKQSISKKMYDDLDKYIDYGCVFTSGCHEECSRCPLCQTSKEQLVDILSGNRRDSTGECSILVNCATDCIEKSGTDLSKINFCLRHRCAFHCFDGSCPKCSAFVTRIFNQVCVAADFRSRVVGWSGHCYEMFRDIVAVKYADEFQQTGLRPSIGTRQQSQPERH